MQSEKDKMLSGKLYKASDAMLTAERLHAKELVFDFNNQRPAEAAARIQIIRQLFGRTGTNFLIEPPFHCDYGYNIFAGDNFYVNYNCVILDCAKVTIGNNVFIAPNVSIFTAGHPINASTRNAEWEYAFPVTIGNDVWIGGNTVINPGVTIGDNVVIGSGSVVTKDIPADSVAAGNPCKVLRPINEADALYYFKQHRINNVD
ncbi:sugar O-acetyltransferase [Ferruginibacter paludis]|uniref:sugar O-acetyltransferase n=1 Tax=Ferruginibacter paludis TaxID=1310417 RepID=UPI0025B5240A|nr:sugar O-acetyltransferase [Ferruginibacter paludis]MDN3655893.1 sugar O-acetyltransferase [Ferruginibacter paludis]